MFIIKVGKQQNEIALSKDDILIFSKKPTKLTTLLQDDETSIFNANIFVLDVPVSVLFATFP